MSSLRSISVTRALALYTRQRGCMFTAGGEPEPALVVMAPEAFLPVLALHADAKCRELMGRNLPGVEIREDASAMLGVYAAIDPLTGDDDSTFRIAMFTHSAIQIFGIADGMSIECAPIYEAYRDGLMAHVQKGGLVSWPMAQVSPR